MNLPTQYSSIREWTIVGPMGPGLPDILLSHPILAVDGGARFTPRMDLWVGDADSYAGELRGPNVIRHPPSKDKSDLGLALDLFRAPLSYKFHLWGFLGGRIDHELFNLGEVSSFLESSPGSAVSFYLDQPRPLIYFMGQGTWELEHTGTFSLGSIKGALVTLEGDCRYPISKEVLLSPLSSLGLSNSAKGQLKLRNSAPVFMHFSEED